MDLLIWLQTKNLFLPWERKKGLNKNQFHKKSMWPLQHQELGCCFSVVIFGRKFI